MRNLRTATRWAARVGQAVTYRFIPGGIWLLFGGDVVDGLWLGFIGWFLLSATQAETTQAEAAAVFGGITVGAVMGPMSLSVSPSMALQQVVEDHLLPHGVPAVPVTELERLVGVGDPPGHPHVPRDRWAEATRQFSKEGKPCRMSVRRHRRNCRQKSRDPALAT
jgi:hypothetical protein